MTTGVIRYGFHDSVAVIDSTKEGRTAQDVIGFGGGIPVVASLKDAMKFQPEALIVGVTPPGGRLSDEIKHVLIEAINHGLDCYAGLHDFLEDDEDLFSEADRMGVELWDLRRSDPDLPVGSGKCRHAKSYVALAVGSDAAIGKMTVALEVVREAQRRNIQAEFVATGQVGIAIAGWGSPIDAIAGDFMAGSVERDVLSCDGEADIIFVEGQGALLHPGFSSVTLGLLHGALPDGLILCHQVGREMISRIGDIPIPPLDEVIESYLQLARHLKPTELVAVSLNTSQVDDEGARKAIRETEELLGVPSTDPVRYGPGPLVDALEKHRKSIGK